MTAESIPGCYQRYGNPMAPNNCRECEVKASCKQATASTPVIKCLPRTDFSEGMRFWCPFCKRWHYHGKNGDSRSPHCNSESPMYQTGYVIRMTPKAELREIAKAINEYLERK